MSYADHVMRDFARRTARPGDIQMDGAYQFETAVLRDMLTRLEVILEDEGVDRGTCERVIRCMLYGAPSPAAVDLRMRQADEMAEMLRRMPPLPVHIPGLGLPPL
jgi:hypothetical protein